MTFKLILHCVSGFGAAAAARLPVRPGQQTVGHSAPGSPRGSAPRPAEPQAGPAPAEPQAAEFSGSILKNNMEVEEAMELQRHLDETGVHQVCTIYA